MVERRVKHDPELAAPERRRPHEPTMVELLTFLNKQVSEMREELSAHMRDETAELTKSVTMMMHEAFPEGDPTGHRKHHEAVIKKAEASAKFWTDMASSTAKWGIFGFLTWLVYAAWVAFLKGPQ